MKANTCGENPGEVSSSVPSYFDTHCLVILHCWLMQCMYNLTVQAAWLGRGIVQTVDNVVRMDRFTD